MKKKEFRVKVNDKGFSSDLYSKIPCTVAYSYVRMEVDGSVKPCCISKFKTGDAGAESFDEIWHGQRQEAFRSKLLTIAEKKFHKTDPEWGFCQQCSHKDLNMRNHLLFQKKMTKK